MTLTWSALIHELRNQLTVVRANIEAISDGKMEPTPERLAGVLQALDKIDLLTHDLRAADSEMPVRLEAINVCQLLVNEFRALEAVAQRKRVQFSIQRCARSHPECTHFLGDPTRISQIVKNVILNAVKYTPAGGTVNVDCSRRADQLELTISDTGPGIKPGERSQLFRRGYRGSAARGISGAGYGLSLARDFVEAHGGTLELRKTSRAGSTFVVSFPGRPVGSKHSALCESCAAADTC